MPFGKVVSSVSRNRYSEIALYFHRYSKIRRGCLLSIPQSDGLYQTAMADGFDGFSVFHTFTIGLLCKERIGFLWVV
jgi:hypothetical protein